MPLMPPSPCIGLFFNFTLFVCFLWLCVFINIFIFFVVNVVIISKGAWWWMNSFSTPGTCHLQKKKILKEKNPASLQEDLNRITEWSLLWELPFNEDKCKCMHIGKRKEQTFISYERLCSTKFEEGEGSRNTHR